LAKTARRARGIVAHMTRLRLNLLVLSLAVSFAGGPPLYGAADQAYAMRNIAGWSVHINPALLATNATVTEQALELLTVQLEEIVRNIPAPAVAELRKVPLWISPEYPATKPRAEYHPNADWLREHGRDPAMAKGVEFSNIRIFKEEVNRMPNFALHELAHAYHDRVLPRGFDNPRIKAAYRKAKTSGKYEQVEQWHGNGKPNTFGRAYAMTNPQEYFAENTEACFSRNDFFPFTRNELKQYDPEMFALLQELWNQQASKEETDASRESRGIMWKHSP
jgi:hypothetical protein